ncbi:UV-B-induced protein At3g17800, chloroplastic-like [Abrus precatorius]|uniref:UV-B-induced protein At3g17800, chloroplastic-like n=1 Tax=Abrus precatorius TaxID=3816 RepID=A0A8B8JV48_ABRPR|nr:UV-B-induced protein At3g17800, chloroplastic-like [Abrus precatorius]
MENCVWQQHHHLRTMVTFPSPTPSSSSSSSLKPHLRFLPRKHVGYGKGMRVRASGGRRHCDFSSINAPLEPKSLVGKFLSGVFQNHRQLFHVVAKEELKLLSDDRDSAVARMLLTHHSDEALLHRRIAQVKENECMLAIEDVMYLLILYKFSEIRVHLVPKLSSCLYNGRLEILPSKDWDLESIHCVEVLDIIRDHVNTVTGLKPNSSVKESWATTSIRQFWLARVYVASILYGYFLKSVSLRYHLERSLSLSNDLHHGHRTHPSFHDMCRYNSNHVALGQKGDIQSVWNGLIRHEEGVEDLKCYAMGFHPGSLQRCAKLRSKEAVHLVESHSHALFGNGEESGFKEHDVILTSYSSLRRLVLEAVAFGSFLWETEDYIDNIYKLNDHEVV